MTVLGLYKQSSKYTADIYQQILSYLKRRSYALLSWKTVKHILEIYHFNLRINANAWNQISYSFSFQSTNHTGGGGGGGGGAEAEQLNLSLFEDPGETRLTKQWNNRWSD